jgi:hypothetical protein
MHDTRRVRGAARQVPATARSCRAQGGIGAKARTAALTRLQPGPGQPPLLAVTTGSYMGEGFDCPTLDTLHHDTATSVLAASLAKRSAGSPASASPTPPYLSHTQFVRSRGNR